MKRRGWIIVGVMLVGCMFFASPDVSQGAPPGSPNPGNPASTVNPPGLQPVPPASAWAAPPPAFCDIGGLSFLPPYCDPHGQRESFRPPGQTQTPPGETVTSPGHTTDDDDPIP